MQTISNKSIAALVAAVCWHSEPPGPRPCRANKKFYSDDPIWSTPKPVAVTNAAQPEIERIL